jgi:uncharacterized membrane protein YhfC
LCGGASNVVRLLRAEHGTIAAWPRNHPRRPAFFLHSMGVLHALYTANPAFLSDAAEIAYFIITVVLAVLAVVAVYDILPSWAHHQGGGP